MPRSPKIGYPAKNTRETLLSTEGDISLIKYSMRLIKLRITTGNNMSVQDPPYRKNLLDNPSL